jgi:hypothetical protein
MRLPSVGRLMFSQSAALSRFRVLTGLGPESAVSIPGLSELQKDRASGRAGLSSLAAI